MIKKQICLNRSVLTFMNDNLTSESKVLEFGGGWSSKWFSHRCGKLVVIETSFNWVHKIKKDLLTAPRRGVNTRIIVPRVGILYNNDLDKMLIGVADIDLVLIDCTEDLRNAATQFAWPLIRQGGWLLFDDAQRERHADIVSWLGEIADAPVRLDWQPGDLESAVERITLAWQKQD